MEKKIKALLKNTNGNFQLVTIVKEYPDNTSLVESQGQLIVVATDRYAKLQNINNDLYKFLTC